MGTGPSRHLRRALWHQHGVAQDEMWPGRVGKPASQDSRGQSRGARPGDSGAAGPMAAGRSPRTRDAGPRASVARQGFGAPRPRLPLPGAARRSPASPLAAGLAVR